MFTFPWHYLLLWIPKYVCQVKVWPSFTYLLQSQYACHIHLDGAKLTSFFFPISAFPPEHYGAKNSSRVLVVCLYLWVKKPHRGKPSPSQQLIPQLTEAASFRKATQDLMHLCSSQTGISPTSDNAPSPQPLLLVLMDTRVSSGTSRITNHHNVYTKLNYLSVLIPPSWIHNQG